MTCPLWRVSVTTMTKNPLAKWTTYKNDGIPFFVVRTGFSTKFVANYRFKQTIAIQS